MKKIFSLLALSLFVTTFAYAEGDHPCKADREKFCKDVKAGGGAIVKCLKGHEAELSAACKTSFEEKKAKIEAKREERKTEHKASREACKSDMEKFCKDVKPGDGKKMDCLKSHEAELSEGCKVGFKK